MSQFNLFSRTELSFLVSSKSKLSETTKAEIKAYCEAENIKKDGSRIFPEDWYKDHIRINIVEQEGALRLAKTSQAQKTDFNLYLLALVVIVLLLSFAIYTLITKDQSKADFGWLLLSTCVMVYILYAAFKEVNIRRAALGSHRALLLERNNITYLYNHAPQVQGDVLSTIRFYWERDYESDNIEATLEVQLESKQIIRIDEDGDYRELFTLADQIRTLTGARLLITNRRPPQHTTFKL